jgi:hypothetical protein
VLKDPSPAPPPAKPAPEAKAAAPAAALDEERKLAIGTFDSGDKAQGKRVLERLFTSGKERVDLDLSAEAERLYEAETLFSRRREYAEYMARKGQTPSRKRLFEMELERAERHLGGVESEPERAPAAWEALSLAYELALDASQRREALNKLEPFLDRMIFSGRFSPLLEGYTVVPGDSLSKIAAKLGSTVDALKRLNSLQAEVIQPRMRLRGLSGKVAVHVDKSDFRLWLTVDGRVLMERPVGLGRENRTPAGEFVVAVRQKNPTWFRPGEPPIPAGDPRNVLGSRWLGFQATKEFAGYGLHGTEDAASIGSESSAGCVRLRNEDIELIFDFVPLGTRVLVRP